MSPRAHEWLVRLASWGLGGVFIYAGVLKVADPLAFAHSIASFWILSVLLITPVALALPVLEGVLGSSVTEERTSFRRAGSISPSASL